VSNLRNLLKKINPGAPLRLQDPMSAHTTFKVGGPAEYYIAPADPTELVRLYQLCLEYKFPFFILGGGANLLVSDAGIEGLVIDTTRVTGITCEQEQVQAWAGTPMSELAAETVRRGLKGLETFYAMPGSVGGSIWMNARCYGVALSDVLESVESVDARGRVRQVPLDPAAYAYKVSPFQKERSLILRGTFRLKPQADATALLETMQGYEKDRREKGHFLYPSAGSVFKNNHAFGEPTGKLIDALGLKGLSFGGARVSELHGNFIVNTGTATAQDIAALIRLVKEKVK
jgi:UDP-N-acetylmuramate dehydrogenase